MKRIYSIVLVLSLLLVPALHAEVEEAQRIEIEKLLKLTGMEKLVDQMMVQMMTNIKGVIPKAPPAFWEKFTSKFKARELLDLMIPIYAKHYSLEDLKGINAFYNTPTGQKVIATMPLIMQDSMAVGQQWGQALGKKAIEEFEAAKKAGN